MLVNAITRVCALKTRVAADAAWRDIDDARMNITCCVMAPMK